VPSIAWGEPGRAGKSSLQPLRYQAMASCGCASACGLHGHDHVTARGAKVPASGLKVFLVRWAAPAGQFEAL